MISNLVKLDLADVIDDSQPISIDVWTCEQFNNETECLAHECYWYNDSCHSTPETQGLADITDTNYPSSVQRNTSFDMIYTVTNTGDADTLYGGLYENGTLIEGSEWSETFTAGQIKAKTISFPNGISAPLNAIIQVGHEEN